MFRITRLVLFSGAALAQWPVPAAAQFQAGSWIPGNPLYPLAPYRLQPSFGVPSTNSVYGRMTVYVPNGLPNPLATASPFYTWYSNPRYRPAAGTMPWMGGSGSGVTSGYMSGGTVNNNVLQNAQREFQKAQRQATTDRQRREAKNVVSAPWAYEKGSEVTIVVPKSGEAAARDLAAALAGDDEDALLSGESLNVLLAAVSAAEARGARGPSAFLPPEVMNAVRFAGPPAADALNLMRQAGSLPFPPSFGEPALKNVRDELERDFADASALPRDGKPADAARLTKLQFTLEKALQAAAPVLRNLPFDDASAGRRFFHELGRALGVLRTPASTVLVNAGWATEGASVTDLVRHMAKHRLLFGPAPAGGEDAYAALHRGLATYLLVLTQPKK